jgi:hypothetical protein
MQLEIDCYEWVLGTIDVNKISFDRLEQIIRDDTDNLWTKIESLQWVLFVIFAIKNDRMIVIYEVPKYSRFLFN